MKTIRTTLALVFTLAALAPLSAQAFCGFYAGKADAHLFNEASQVVLVRDGSRTVLSMRNDYQGPLREFALVVPTPTTLQKGQVRIADPLVFERLDAYSSPRLAEYHDQDPCQLRSPWGQEPYPTPVAMPMAAGVPGMALRDKALGVTVEAQYTLEEYDIVSLSATQSDGLETWLQENGYKIPKGASAAFKPYINQGMKFFVAKVNLEAQAKTGYTLLRPLQFAFESEKFMLPLRLGMLNAPPDKAQDLIVYLLTREGRVESSNYRTVKLPANLNLPFFTKPRFQDFYKALFDNQAAKEQHRVVFTEYFWDMAWCDPCAAKPLSSQELRDAGVFWVDGNADAQFGAMRAPAGAPQPLGLVMLPPASGAQPVVLTRLHVRYTANTFPEDLMFTQTRDRQNWQARYVIQQPYEGTVAACSATAAQIDCDAQCKPRVAEVQRPGHYFGPSQEQYRDKSSASLQGECVSACTRSKQEGLQAATRYYQQALPARLRSEKQTLAELTGWGLAQIDAMPGAGKFSAPDAREPAKPAKTWWEQLFSVNQLR